MGKKGNDRPFWEKLMLLPDDYEIFKFGGGYNGYSKWGYSDAPDYRQLLLDNSGFKSDI